MFNFFKKRFSLDESIKKNTGVSSGVQTLDKGSLEIPKFEAFKELYQIKECFSWITYKNQKISLSVLKAIDRILWLHLSKDQNYLYANLKNIFIRKSDLRKFKQFDNQYSKILFCIASLNSNGYIREIALKQLVDNIDEISFPFIMYRLNDWVPEIRENAKTTIIKQAPKLTQLFIKNHKLTKWLLKVKRNKLLNLHTKIEQSIFADKNIETILNDIENYNDGERFYILKYMINNDLLSSKMLLSFIVDKNHLIRLMVIRNFEILKHPKIVIRLLQDKSTKVRIYTLNRLSTDDIKLYKKEMTSLLSGSSGRIRAKARHHLENLGSFNFHTFYINEINKNIKFGNIMGLSEVGTKDDISFLLKLLDKTKNKLKSGVLLSISKLDYEQGQQLALEHLTDKSLSVKKSCIIIIPKKLQNSVLPIVRKIYQQSDNQTRLTIIKIIGKYRRWDILGDFIKALNENNSELQFIAKNYIKKWYGYSLKLGITQRDEDREYVLNQYNEITYSKIKFNDEELDLVIKNIPFIFKT